MIDSRAPKAEPIESGSSLFNAFCEFHGVSHRYRRALVRRTRAVLELAKKRKPICVPIGCVNDTGTNEARDQIINSGESEIGGIRCSRGLHSSDSIEVTPEMIQAGWDEYCIHATALEFHEPGSVPAMVAAVYKVMAEASVTRLGSRQVASPIS